MLVWILCSFGRMQGLFYSVTATFTTLVLAVFLFVVEHYQQFSSVDLGDPRQSKAQATLFLETLESDLVNMFSLTSSTEGDSFSCRVSMTRNGRTRFFTFPTIRKTSGKSMPEIVQVTYELEGQAQQVDTHNGKRDLYKLRRHLNGNEIIELPGVSTNQIVDFLVELIPTTAADRPIERIVSGGCPTDLDQVYIEFYVAMSEVPNYISINKYSTTVQRPTSSLSLSHLVSEAD